MQLTRVTLCLFLVACVAAQCKVVSPVSGLNVTEFTDRPWYVQKQMVVAYLPINEFFCVRANYTVTSPTTIGVFNYANIDKVNGAPTGGDLCAAIKTPSIPAKLSVGPCFLPSALYGPYWVLSVGPSADNYEYALISGGQPTIQTSNGCKTGSGVNNAGLWIFSRTQVAPASEVNMVQNQAISLGFDVSVLSPVVQQGCIYPPL